MYHTIGEVAAMFNVNTSLIRFWEKEFSIIKPRRNRKGNRLFTKDDVDNFHQIFHLVKERGFTLAGAKEKLKHQHEEVAVEFEVVRTLQELKKFLLDIKKELTKAEKNT